MLGPPLCRSQKFPFMFRKCNYIQCKLQARNHRRAHRPCDGPVLPLVYRSCSPSKAKPTSQARPCEGCVILSVCHGTGHHCRWAKFQGEVFNHSSPLRERRPTPGLLPGESHGQRSLVGYSPWGDRVRHDRATSLSFFLSPK